LTGFLGPDGAFSNTRGSLLHPALVDVQRRLGERGHDLAEVPGITSPSGLKFGQVVTTFVDVVSDSAGSPYTEVNTPPQSAYLPGCSASSAAPTPNDISVQANTNNFPAVTGDAFQNGDKAWAEPLRKRRPVSFRRRRPWAKQRSVLRLRPGMDTGT
jgi:hypothetical protein